MLALLAVVCVLAREAVCARLTALVGARLILASRAVFAARTTVPVGARLMLIGRAVVNWRALALVLVIELVTVRE